MNAIRREELWIESAPGVTVHVRVVRPAAVTGRAVVLVHGARAAGVASFDLPVPGGSIAADLAAAGHPVYLPDVRGFGGSTRPSAMDRPASDSAPLVRAGEAAADIAAVAGAVAHGRPVALFGWATGSVWAGLVAVEHPELISHLFLHNTLYGGSAGHPTLAKASGGYRLSTREDLLGNWDQTIPADDPVRWRDPDIAEAYVREALAGDPTSVTRRPPSCRSPAGPLADAFRLATGGWLWDAAHIRCRVLVSRGGLDFLSRPQDRVNLLRDLRGAHSVDDLELPDGTHFVHLERPERGRRALLAAVTASLAVP